MINQGGGVTQWIYVLVLAAVGAHILYKFFTSASRKPGKKSDSSDSGGSSNTMIDNGHRSGDFCASDGGASDCGGGDGGGDGGGGGD